MEQGSQHRKTSNTSHPASWQKSWREGATPTAQKRAHVSSSPVHDGFSIGTPPSCNASEDGPNNSSKLKMPKHFAQPLTCFYWHMYGHCKKADDDCLYAHHDTGVVASAPFAMDAGQAPMAGRNGMKQLNEHAKKEKELNDKEAWLTAREMELNSKSRAMQTPQAVEDAIRDFYEVITDAKAILSETHTALNRHYQTIAELDAEGEGQCTAAMEAAIAEVATIGERIVKLEKQSEGRLGRPTSIPDAARVYLDVHGE